MPFKMHTTGTRTTVSFTERHQQIVSITSSLLHVRHEDKQGLVKCVHAVEKGPGPPSSSSHSLSSFESGALLFLFSAGSADPRVTRNFLHVACRSPSNCSPFSWKAMSSHPDMATSRKKRIFNKQTLRVLDEVATMANATGTHSVGGGSRLERKWQQT